MKLVLLIKYSQLNTIQAYDITKQIKILGVQQLNFLTSLPR